MKFDVNGKARSNEFGGIGFVIVLHVIIIYMFVHDANRLMITSIRPPAVVLKIVEQIKKPPPPDILPPPKSTAPPPPYIPLLEVTVTERPQDAPTITQTTAVPPPAPLEPLIHITVPAEADDLTGSNVNGSMLVRNGCELLDYPWIEQRERHTGSVFLSFLISSEGSVIASKIDKSSGYPKLDEAARAGITLCKFKPTMVNGVARQAWKKLEYVWTLGF